MCYKNCINVRPKCELSDDVLNFDVGMNKKSKDFALELLDAISRRRNFNRDSINKAQLKDCWNQICDHNFDSRLRIFFDM